MCYSPFAIEELGETQHYEMGEQMGIDSTDPALKLSQNIPQYAKLNELITQVLPEITQLYGTKRLQAAAKENADYKTLLFGNIGFRVSYRHPIIKCKEGACMIAQTKETEFLILGCGCHAEPFSVDDRNPYIEYLSLEEGYMCNGTWRMVRKLNGDEERIVIDTPQLLRVKLNLY